MRGSLIIFLTAIAILINTPAFGSNRVLSLDGDGDYVEIADNGILGNVGSQVTVEVWIKPTEFAAPWIGIALKTDESGPPDWRYRSYVLQLTSQGSIHLSSSPSGQGQISLNSQSGSIVPNIWYHVAGIVDAKSGVMRIFINGAEVARGGSGADIHVSSLPLVIGRGFAGQMDELRIWNVARTQEEILSMMNTTLPGKEAGLVGYWRFDDLGDTVVDSSPNQTDGRLAGDANLIEDKLPDVDELVIPAVISGVVTDGSGQPISDAAVRLEQDGEEIAQVRSDAQGNYLIAFSQPGRGLYDISATSGDRGSLQLGISLRDGENQEQNLILKKAISVDGTLLMLDYRTPHVAVVVQAVRSGKVAATTLSDEAGRYQFISLKPGWYQVRCQVSGGYVYYRATDDALRVTHYGEQAAGSAMEGDAGETLHVELGKTLENVDLHFPPFKKGTWRRFTSHQGLLHNRVVAIYGAPDGIMWFGTFGGGVSRYDGEGFINFTTEDGLTHQDVLTIHYTPDAMMWFGTGGFVAEGGGISRYDGEEFVNFTAEYGLPDKGVWDLHRDPDGAMWFATYGSGVFRYDGNEFANFTKEDGLAHDLVLDIYRDPSGAMWFGTAGGVSRYDGEEFTSFTRGDGLVGNWINDIYCDPSGVMWFAAGLIYGNLQGGVCRYHGKEFVSFTKEDGLASDYVMAICGDPDGMLWFATDGGGVSRYDGKGFVNFTKADGLSHNRVWAIHRDPDGVMWFGTWGGGVSRYDSKEFVKFTTKDGLTNDDVAAIHRDASGVMWIGTIGGISQYDGKEFVNFTTEDGSIAHNQIYAIDSEPDGVVWFGTQGGGVLRYDGREFANLTTKDGLPNNTIRAVHRDPGGVMWFGTGGGGVSRYDGEEFTNFTTQDGLVNNTVQGIYRAPDGMLWLVTDNGISCYDGSEFANFTSKDGLAGNDVHAVCSDADGVVWFGAEGGVSRYDGRDFAKFTVRDGLAHSDIRAICFTSDGVLWCGTYGGGVSMYDGTTWSSLDMRDGLAGDVVLSIYQDSDGSLWFGTEGGITHYRRSTDRPKVHIVSVTADQPYHDLSAIPAFATGTRVTVEYKALDFRTVPEKRQYRCRIREVDSDWRKPVKTADFDHTFGKPGTYTFEVQAIDRDLNYSEPASIELKIVPPFYLRAVFLVPFIGSGTIMLVALVILATVLTKRRRQVHAYERMAVQELQDAREMQMSLLPEAAPVIEVMEIAGRSVTANTVGGDFFDYLSLPDGRTGIAIADVSGKGLRAAMNAVLASGMLDEITKMEESCGKILSELNAGLYPRMDKQMFTAFSFAILDRDSGVIQWSNAGQPLPLIKRNDVASEADGDGELPLGMAPDVKYLDYKLELQQRDAVIFYTDGIIEAENEAEEMYGTERLLDLVAGIDSSASAEGVIEAILQDVSSFVGSSEQYDDMTVVVLKKVRSDKE